MTDAHCVLKVDIHEFVVNIGPFGIEGLKSLPEAFHGVLVAWNLSVSTMRLLTNFEVL